MRKGFIISWLHSWFLSLRCNSRWIASGIACLPLSWTYMSSDAAYSLDEIHSKSLYCTWFKLSH